jgi:putative transposase
MKRTTTQKKITPGYKEIKEQIERQEDYLRPMVELIVQETLEREMDETLGAQKGERSHYRVGHRSGY